jgi:glutathione S-transferase
MITLYCFPRSGNSREVKLVMAEKGIAYNPVNVHAPDFNKEDEHFKKASPRGTVPAIIDGETYMSEAYDINIYLDQKYPNVALLPKNEARQKQIREFVMIYDKRLCLKIGLLLIEELLKPKERQKEETKVKLRGEIREGLKALEKHLRGQDYFFGEYSLADISMTPHLSALGRVNMALTDEYPNLLAWFERIKSRPSFEASAN